MKSNHISLWYVPKKYQRMVALSSMVRQLMKENALTQSRCHVQNFKARYLISMCHFAKKQSLSWETSVKCIISLCWPRKIEPFTNFFRVTPEFQVYKFSMIIFGGCYCFSWYTRQIHPQSHKNDYPLPANAIKIETLLDDLMPSVLTAEEAQETRLQWSGLRDQPEFHIRTEWL